MDSNTVDGRRRPQTGLSELNAGVSPMTSTPSRTDCSETGPWLAVGRATAAVLLLLFLASCRDPLNVPDPNSIQSEDLNQPSGVPSLVNGALTNMNESLGEVAAIYATASDEAYWIGTRQAWQSLSQGFIDDPLNEFSDAAFPNVAQARFMVDRAVDRAEQFQGDLADESQLVRAYLFGAVVYATIADVYDDFVIPDEPGQAVPPMGPDNMADLYGQAIEWLDAAESLATDMDAPELATRAVAYRARVRHGRAVWQKLNPPGSSPSEPLVSNQQMADDALAALQRVGTRADWSWEAEYTSNTVDNNLAWQINQRGELQFGLTYVNVDPESDETVTGVALTDPVTGSPSPVIQRKINEFSTAAEFASLSIVTARELHLLLAEHNLAEADTAAFRSYINNVRSIAGQQQYTDQVPPMEMLRHARQANLFFMNRRLADMYRFGASSGGWLPQAPAATEPGTFFPIAITEIRSNPNL